jgi:hypothetical protein
MFYLEILTSSCPTLILSDDQRSQISQKPRREKQLPLHLPHPPPSFSCPSHGDTGNARLRFFTTGRGGEKGAAGSDVLRDVLISCE